MCLPGYAAGRDRLTAESRATHTVGYPEQWARSLTIVNGHARSSIARAYWKNLNEGGCKDVSA